MPAATPALLSPLCEGDRLTRAEFLRRWDAMPGLNKAELIDGVVYMPSPVSWPHRRYHVLISGWLVAFEAATPGVESGSNGTWIMSDEDVPQPDADLRILPERGGQSRVESDYPVGAPELVAEISNTTNSKYAGEKLRLYERAGVREYLIVRPDKRQIVWRTLAGRRYVEMTPGNDGVWRSRVFPGLWLDPEALWNRDSAGLTAAVRAGAASPEHARFIESLTGKTGS